MKTRRWPDLVWLVNFWDPCTSRWLSIAACACGQTKSQTYRTWSSSNQFNSLFFGLNLKKFSLVCFCYCFFYEESELCCVYFAPNPLLYENKFEFRWTDGWSSRSLIPAQLATTRLSIIYIYPEALSICLILLSIFHRRQPIACLLVDNTQPKMLLYCCFSSLSSLSLWAKLVEGAPLGACRRKARSFPSLCTNNLILGFKYEKKDVL